MALAALYASVFSFSLSFGGIMPWMALAMETRGTDATLIGIVSAAGAVGVLVGAPLVPRMLNRFGAADAMILAGIVMVGAVIALPVLDSPAAWIVLRFVSGCAGAVPWVVTETWVNAVAEDRSRGRAIAAYGTALAAGYACGPLVLVVAGAEGATPVMIFAGLEVLAIVPILFIRRLAPVIDLSGPVRMWAMVWAMPVLLAAAFLAGSGDTALFAFLPIWGLHGGLDEAMAVTLLSVFVAGNVALQVPLGWMADKAGFRRMMGVCGLICLAGPVLSWWAVPSVPLLAVTFLIWGGAKWGLYSIALAELGVRFKGGTLAGANAAFVMVYTFANIAAPPAAGLAIKAWDPHGLLALMFALSAGFFVLLALRRRPSA
jgi:MFS family permease